MINCFN